MILIPYFETGIESRQSHSQYLGRLHGILEDQIPYSVIEDTLFQSTFAITIPEPISFLLIIQARVHCSNVG